MSDKKFSREGLCFIVLCICLGCLLDILSSFVGFSLGLQESSLFFLGFPAAWSLMLMGLAGFINWMPSAPFSVKGFLMIFICLFSMLPSVSNTILILEVVF